MVYMTDDEFINELEREESGDVNPEVTSAEGEADREEQQSRKAAQAQKAKHEETDVVTRSEYLIDRFMETASDDEKRIFDIVNTGDEDPRKVKAAIDMAKTKAAELNKTLSTEVEEKAQEKADEMAAAEYGVGPLTSSARDNVPPEQSAYQDLWGHVQKEGDPKALVSLLAEDSQFIDAVINGRPLGKK